jgi:hypothetical protein
MKKVLTLLLIIFLYTGCSIKKIDDKDMNALIDNTLKEEITLSNINDKGYNYYLPESVRLDDSNDYNKQLYSNGYNYYLYIDIISYFYKTPIAYDVNSKAYFSKKIDYKNKSGYVEINKINNKYFIQVMYNYAKIEAFVDKNNLNDTIVKSCYILSTIKFNDKIIETLLGNNTLDYNAEKFEVLKPKREAGAFLDYIQMYDKYNNVNKEIPDEDQIIPDEDQEL